MEGGGIPFWSARLFVGVVEFLLSRLRFEKQGPFIREICEEYTMESAAGLFEGMEIVVASVDADSLDSYPLKGESTSAW
jgi:hypothetical protein